MRTYRPPLCAATATLAIAAFLPAARAGTAVPEQAASVASLESEVMTGLNQVRASHGLRPYRLSTPLHAAALRHSREMARYGYFEHVSPNGGAFWRRIAWYYTARGYLSWSVGENIEYGQPGLGPAEVVHDWLSSPLHRANIVSTSWRDAAVGAIFVTSAPGVFQGLPTTIVTLDVGRRSR